MNATTRQFIEAPLQHGEDEGVGYALTVPTSWTANPSSPVVVIKNSAGTDVTATTTQGSASVVGQVITTPKITGVGYRVHHSLSEGGITKGQKYRLEVRFTTASGGELEAFGEIVGQE